ncbi:unnamed protein product [Periconia digitata]|uniref:Uncharacterized protein n=1 Tax=Periconia digitata TaxID=1303443 RepID=A0A9W4UHF3_9PLEO|nr:unnamed protein product [Periconia digitata]
MPPSRGYNNRASPRMDPEDAYYSNSSDEERLDRQANDRRLRQAIAYLANEGGEDKPATYIRRIQAIDEHILKGYSAENYAFDPSLYRQLRAMVREVQGDLDYAAEEEIVINPVESDASDPEPIEALYRTDDGPDDDAAGGSDEDSPSSSNRADRLLTFRNPLIKGNGKYVDWDAVPSEKQFKYGQELKIPPERWLKTFPPMIPFGETLYMQEWENLKIHFDLSEAKNQETAVTTNVPYEILSDEFHPNEETFQSGSRFRLPKISEGMRKQVERSMDIEKTVNEFNNFVSARIKTKHNPNKATVRAPRLFLRKVS